MASPQKENGYTAIANELIEAFMRLNLSCYEWRILFCIIRFSYGWNKKTAQLTCTQLSKLTGIDVRLIPRALKSLQKKNIIIRDKNTLQLQKDYHKWTSSIKMSSLQMKNFISTDENPSSLQMKNFISTDEKNSSKYYSANDLREAKDIYKDIYKDISLRERLLERLKIYFSNIDIPSNVQDKRIDYFLYLIEQGKINPYAIENPVKYIQSHKLVLKQFPSLLEREAEKKKAEKEQFEKLKKERFERQKIDRKEMKQLFGTFRMELERKHLTN